MTHTLTPLTYLSLPVSTFTTVLLNNVGLTDGYMPAGYMNKNIFEYCHILFLNVMGKYFIKKNISLMLMKITSFA